MLNFEQDMKEYEKAFPKQVKIINDVKFTYRLGGKGEKTLVLLAGGLGMSDMFYNHARKFASNFKVLLFDYPHGYKTNMELVDGIAGLIRELNLGKVVLTGQSYGGFVAQNIAVRHKDIVSELIISNTGCISDALSETDMKSIYEMIEKMKKVRVMTRIVPIALLRGKFIRQSMEHLKGCSDAEKEYMHSLFEIMFHRLTNQSERHMCSLMIDLLNLKRSSKNDFAYLDGKVLLILSKDDETFSDTIKVALIELMPNPKVCDSLSGGHLALALKIDSYISLVKGFLMELKPEAM